MIVVRLERELHDLPIIFEDISKSLTVHSETTRTHFLELTESLRRFSSKLRKMQAHRLRPRNARILFRYQQGARYSQIAREFGISPTRAREIIFHAQRKHRRYEG